MRTTIAGLGLKPKRTAVVLSLVLAFCSGTHAQNCGLDSLLNLAHLLGRDVPADVSEDLRQRFPGDQASMLQIQEAGASLGLDLVGVAATLDELAAFRGPKIAHLDGPEHFLVLAHLSPEWAQVWEGRSVAVADRADVAERFMGNCLVVRPTDPAEGEPVLHLADFHHEFGLTGVGQTVSHTFGVRNTGAADLVLRERASNCRGLDVTVAPEVIPPGGSGEVTARLAVDQGGPLTISAALLSNDPWCPVTYITMRGAAPHDLEVDPDRLIITGTLDPPSTSHLRVMGPPDMDLTGASIEGERLAVQLGEPTIDARGRRCWVLTVSTTDQTSPGNLTTRLLVETTHPERPHIAVPLSARLRGPVNVQPPTAFFGFVPLSVERTIQVVLSAGERAPFGVRSVECDHPDVTVGEPEQWGPTWRVAVALRSAEIGIVETELVVTTDLPTRGTVRVPVYGHVGAGLGG